MSALVFSNSPTVGQTVVFNNRNYTWDGTSWIATLGLAASATMKIFQFVCVGGETSVTFANIPQTFTNLEVTITGQDTAAGTTLAGVFMQMNGDATSGNYSSEYFMQSVNGAPNGSLDASTANGAICGFIPGTSGLATAVGTTEIFIPGYAATTFQKLVQFNASAIYSGPTQVIRDAASIWKSTAAITQLKWSSGATAFAAGTTFTVIGVGGSNYNANASGPLMIGQVVCVGGETSIAFNSIPQSFSDLEFEISVRDTAAGSTDLGLFLQFNGDSTSGNYTGTESFTAFGGGSTAPQGIAATTHGNRCAACPGVSGNANAYANSTVKVQAYARTVLFKGFVSTCFEWTNEVGAARRAQILTGGWNSAAAINSATFYPSGTAFAAGSVISAYAKGGT